MHLVIEIRAKTVEEGQERKENLRVDRCPERAGWYADKDSMQRPTWASGELN
jgi:hypothetical protein